MRALAGALAAALLGPAAMARAASPEDFAVGFEVVTEREAPVYRVPLDARVYREAESARLADLRVFDARGRPLPHEVRPAPPERGEKAELPMFPLPAEAASGAILERGEVVRVDVRDDGTVVEVVPAGDAVAGARAPNAWLLDASGRDRALRALEFDWEPVASGGFVATPTVEASDDLVSWRAVAVEGALADLSRGERRVRHARIELAATASDYLRVRVGEPLPVTLRAVTAAAVARPSDAALERIELQGTRGDAGGTIWRFELGGPLPVDALEPAWAAGQAVFEATIETADDEDGPWSRRGRGLFYRLRTDAGPITSEPVAVDTRGARWLRLRIEGAAPQVSPTLAARARMPVLHFAADGPGPYRLAVGSARAEPADERAVSRMLETLAQAPELVAGARLGEARVLAGEAARRPEAGLSMSAVLWGVLVLGVALLALMLRSLLREARQG